MAVAWTDPNTWTAAVVTVAEMNTHLRDNTTFLYNPPSLRVTKTAQDIVENTLTEIDWTAADWDDDNTGAMWAAGANSAHLVARTAGIYLINWDLRYEDGSRNYFMEVLLNDAAIGGQGPTNVYEHGTSGLDTRFMGSAVRDLAADDFITFKVRHDDAASENRFITAVSSAGLQWQRGPAP